MLLITDAERRRRAGTRRAAAPGARRRRPRRRARSATSSAAPLTCIAVETGIMPATSTTVVHEIAWYTCGIVSTPSRTIAPAASRPAAAAGTSPVASSTTIASGHDDRLAGLRPERHGLTPHERRLVDGEDVAIDVDLAVERRPLALHEERVADGERSRRRPEVLAAALHGEDHQVAAVGDHPREDHARRRARSGAGSRPRRRRSAGRAATASAGPRSPDGRSPAAAANAATSVGLAAHDHDVAGRAATPGRHSSGDRADLDADELDAGRAAAARSASSGRPATAAASGTSRRDTARPCRYCDD